MLYKTLNKNFGMQLWMILVGAAALSPTVLAQEATTPEVQVPEVQVEESGVKEKLQSLPADAPVRESTSEAKLTDQEIKALREDYKRLSSVRQILAEKPLASTAQQKIEAENVLRLRASGGGTVSNTLGFNGHVSANGLLQLKLSDSKSEAQGKRRITIEDDIVRKDTAADIRDDRSCKRFGLKCKDQAQSDTTSPKATEVKVEKIESSVRTRSYIEGEVGVKVGVHASGVPASAMARVEYRGDIEPLPGQPTLGGAVTAELEENHNPMGPKYGSETVGLKGKIAALNDSLVFTTGVGLGEVHTPGNYGVGLRAHGELGMNLSRGWLNKPCTDDQECAKVSLRYDFFRNIPKNSNIHRGKFVINVPVTDTTSVEGFLQVTDQAALSNEVIKRTDIAGGATYNGSFDLYQIWDRADQAKRVIEIVQATAAE